MSYILLVSPQHLESCDVSHLNLKVLQVNLSQRYLPVHVYCSMIPVHDLEAQNQPRYLTIGQWIKGNVVYIQNENLKCFAFVYCVCVCHGICVETRGHPSTMWVSANKLKPLGLWAGAVIL